MRLRWLNTAARAWNPSKQLTSFQQNQIVIHQGRFDFCPTIFTTRQAHHHHHHNGCSFHSSVAPSQKGIIPSSSFEAFAAMADMPPSPPAAEMKKPARSPKPKAQGKRPAPSQNQKLSQGGKKRQQKKIRKRERDMKTGSTEEVLAFDIRDLRNSLLNESENDGNETPAAEEGEGEESLLPEPGTEILVKVVELSSTGDALALQEGARSKQIYVVPFAVPGDIVKVKVYRHLRDEGYTVADFISVVEPAPARDDARVRCGYFSKCSGCQFQMLDYDEQLRVKRRIVEKAFRNFSELPPELIPAIQDTIGSPLQYGYRTKLTPHFDGPPGNHRRNANNAFTKRPDIGFMLKGKRTTLDIEDCPIGTDAVRAGMKTERERLDVEFSKYKRGATILLRESTLRVPKDGAFESAAGVPAGAVKVEADTHVDWKTCITDNNATSTEYVGDYVFRNPAGYFFQNNNSILPVFTDYIRQHILPTIHPGSIKYLIDAYSGSGLFTITLSSLFQGSTGIDIADKSIEFARTNAAANNLPESQANFIAADAGQLFKSVRYDPDETVVVLDPPRKGCDADFLAQLLRFGPRRVVYVSCNVHTQARDVGMLVRGETGSADASKANEKGTRYEIESLRGFDFFPQTGHVEGVAVLNRIDSAWAVVDVATAPKTAAE
ncbi:uracil-5--methyltransferase [Xylaria scruposa]|nr:uracil-5--methyltransferase [Xylaria scruposa]